ncbi:hypothetical protein MTR67_011545, partial [Solanum verrucosum]
MVGALCSHILVWQWRLLVLLRVDVLIWSLMRIRVLVRQLGRTTTRVATFSWITLISTLLSSIILVVSALLNVAALSSRRPVSLKSRSPSIQILGGPVKNIVPSIHMIWSTPNIINESRPNRTRILKSCTSSSKLTHPEMPPTKMSPTTLLSPKENMGAIINVLRDASCEI